MKAPRPNGYRDTWCGSVLPQRVGDVVRVAGWVHRRRDHGGLVFVDMRDRSGLVQVVFHPEHVPEAELSRIRAARAEYVLAVQGTVNRRPAEMVNRDLASRWVDPRRRNVHPGALVPGSKSAIVASKRGPPRVSRRTRTVQ